jgi:eukaryotic-like serine/threonine-protein kinase
MQLGRHGGFGRPSPLRSRQVTDVAAGHPPGVSCTGSKRGPVRRCPTCHSQYTDTARACPIDGSPLAEVPDPLVGRTIGGRYLVAELVGAGGMGSVYRGRHQLVGRDVALKFLAPRYARDPAARERFLREARAANRIDHEHIIDITDFGETSDNLVFLVMEFLDGELLSKLVERGPLPPARALTVALQLASALARAHELDVIHRDIKPENIFVLQRRGGDFVKLCDFGLAKVIGEHRLTATGKVFGTPEYLAPEQARGEPPTGHTDQYSLGCVLYEMLTGKLPFEGTTPDVILRHLQVVPEKPSARRGELPLPTEIDALVMRMLEKLPRDRFVDAHHVVDEIRRILELLQGGRVSRPSTPRSSSAPSLDPALSATQPWVDAAEESWAQRVDQFSAVLPQAYPSGGAPVAVRSAIADMGSLVARARAVRVALGGTVLRAKEREDRLRQSRMQVGRATDELGRDESRVARRIQEVSAAVDALKKELAEVGSELTSAFAARSVASTMSRRVAEDLRRLGGRASHWLDLDAQLEPLLSRLVSSEREREDLRFQIAQLKGRMGILNAEAEADLGALKEESEQLGAELARILDQLSEAGSQVMQTLGALPGMREKLLQSRASLHAQLASK